MQSSSELQDKNLDKTFGVGGFRETGGIHISGLGSADYGSIAKILESQVGKGKSEQDERHYRWYKSLSISKLHSKTETTSHTKGHPKQQGRTPQVSKTKWFISG